MNYYILIPNNVESGGPELAHQMCAELEKLGKNSKMYYIEDGFEPIDTPSLPKYAKYGVEHAKTREEVVSAASTVIVPEGMTQFIDGFPGSKKVLWWMSVDNYTLYNTQQDLEGLLEKVDLHLAQSKYAYDFLIGNGVDEQSILYVRDYIGENYGQFIFPSEYRNNTALYNPKKGYDKILPIIEKAEDEIQWIPVVNLSEEEIIILMESSKVYVDFGNHPGKDRIPREAASCGCCVITNREGSANNNVDVPIMDMYKFENVSEKHDEVISLIHNIFEQFDDHKVNFDNYRQQIKQEKEEFAKEVERFTKYVESN